jgi:hypothetical protein
MSDRSKQKLGHQKNPILALGVIKSCREIFGIARDYWLPKIASCPEHTGHQAASKRMEA